MFSSGNITIYVSNMEAAIRFYSEILGLKLAYRFGDQWASVELGKGLNRWRRGCSDGHRGLSGRRVEG